MKNKKEIYEEYLMKELRNRLTLHLSNVGEFNGKLILYGSKKDGKYTFYIRNNNVKKVKYNVDFNFSILYEDELDIIRKFEKTMILAVCQMKNMIKNYMRLKN